MKTIKTKQFAVEIYGAEDFCIMPLRDISEREFERILSNVSQEYFKVKQTESETYTDWRESTEKLEHYTLWTATVIINTSAVYLYRLITDDGYAFTKSFTKIVRG